MEQEAEPEGDGARRRGVVQYTSSSSTTDSYEGEVTLPPFKLDMAKFNAWQEFLGFTETTLPQISSLCEETRCRRRSTNNIQLFTKLLQRSKSIDHFELDDTISQLPRPEPQVG
eukprot:1970024-Pyramimonas_sp.AAC.1